MCDDAVRIVMTVMRMISAEMMTRYAGVLSRVVCFRFAIQPVMQGGRMCFEGIC